MKLLYIRSLIESAQSVFSMVCGIEVKANDSILRESPIFVHQVIINIGIIGDFKGQVFFEMSVDTTKRIASAMMGGMPVIELDEMSKSAISEMINMIMGNATISISEQNISIDITPPSVLIGESIEISNKFSTIEVPLELEGIGTMKMNVSAEGVN